LHAGDGLQEEMLRYQERTGSHRLLRLDAFADHTTKVTKFTWLSTKNGPLRTVHVLAASACHSWI
jgi:hypothetical protein